VTFAHDSPNSASSTPKTLLNSRVL